MFDFLAPPIIYVILHIFGAILGAGSAYVSDSMFFLSVKDSKFTKKEIEFLHLGSKLVWLGIGILVISGALLFSQDVEGYMASSKFLAKMTIVGIIVLNGLAFHFKHMPVIERHVGKRLVESKEFRKKASGIVASGALSMISWTATVVLGVLPFVPWSYWMIMGLYAGIVLFGIGTGVALKDRILFR